MAISTLITKARKNRKTLKINTINHSYYQELFPAIR